MSGKILNIVGVVWVVSALVTLGYFAVRDIQIVPALQQGMAAEPGPVKHLIPVRAETAAPK
ncbi:MAG TPA: hypothetical protein VMC04_08475 [Verrucomicrobiae bacterium]|jgi:hypothetical protein|nr:hypothetical protein [Verrucomicrobiae bacterium]